MLSYPTAYAAELAGNPFMNHFAGAVRDTPAYNEAFGKMIALGRVGLPDDIGPMIASLIGPDNGWVTAQRIEVSGGQNIRSSLAIRQRRFNESVGRGVPSLSSPSPASSRLGR